MRYNGAMSEELRSFVSSTILLGLVLLAFRFKLLERLRLPFDVFFLLIASLGALLHTLLATGPVHNLWAIAGLMALTVGTGHLAAAKLELRSARPVLMGVLAVVAIGQAVMGVMGAIFGLEWGVLVLLVAIIAFHGLVRPARQARTPVVSGVNHEERFTGAAHEATTETLEFALLVLYVPLGALLGFLHLKLALNPMWQVEFATSGPPQFVTFGLWYLGVLAAYALIKMKTAEVDRQG